MSMVAIKVIYPEFEYLLTADAADLLTRGLVDVKKLITHRFKFDEAENAFQTFLKPEAGAIKIIIRGVD
jgi:threonine dehydrogenase-like Zn-dependent dehydrogenase